ncbi:hypothetical protein [Mucilaginibacter glaciei]|uniref:Lipoprotein n=1 Tax=Mucilaginibacter glaciei TaxID=2772109 RepID=A0A926NY73_9SPHI|nr:hypothetical protein [Mucilaginibacter glaciei]MBD1394048.1 hypothetical protein [Mucilaginibacter glaciei]
MKKLFPIQNWAVFMAFCALIIVVSCKKTVINDEKPAAGTDVLAAIRKLKNSERLNSQEILQSLNKTLTADQMAELQLSKSQQSIIRGQHVVRIPIAEHSAMYFTKKNDSVSSYAYKWRDNHSGSKYFSGDVFALSYQAGDSKILHYDKGKLNVEDVFILQVPMPVYPSKG